MNGTCWQMCIMIIYSSEILAKQDDKEAQCLQNYTNFTFQQMTHAATSTTRIITDTYTAAGVDNGRGLTFSTLSCSASGRGETASLDWSFMSAQKRRPLGHTDETTAFTRQDLLVSVAVDFKNLSTWVLILDSSLYNGRLSGNSTDASSIGTSIVPASMLTSTTWYSKRQAKSDTHVKMP